MLASLLVNLDPVDALFDSLTDDDSAAVGFGAGAPPVNLNGLTFNLTFTPAAGDLDSTTEALNLIEVGGDANGSGLYLLGGELHFLSKMNGAAGTAPAPANDLDWTSNGDNDIILAKSSFGALVAGTEYSVAAIFDPFAASSLQLAVQPTGGSLSRETFALTNLGARTSWSGDNSVSALRAGNLTNFGGATTTGTSPFAESAINNNPFVGTAGQALYWNLNGSVIPEPSSFGLFVLGLCGLMNWRQRKR